LSRRLEKGAGGAPRPFHRALCAWATAADDTRIAARRAALHAVRVRPTPRSKPLDRGTYGRALLPALYPMCSPVALHAHEIARAGARRSRPRLTPSVHSRPTDRVRIDASSCLTTRRAHLQVSLGTACAKLGAAGLRPAPRRGHSGELSLAAAPENGTQRLRAPAACIRAQAFREVHAPVQSMRCPAGA
jgi:hypothetical protein